MLPTCEGVRNFTAAMGVLGTLFAPLVTTWATKRRPTVATRPDKLAVRDEATVLVAVLNDWLCPARSPLAVPTFTTEPSGRAD
jgi:hypothetical protein